MSIICTTVMWSSLMYAKAFGRSEVTVVIDDQSWSYSSPLYGHCLAARVFDFSGKGNILFVFSGMASR